MIMFIIGWLMIGLIVWGSAVFHDITKRQDKIIKWINESIISKDIPRPKKGVAKEWNLSWGSCVKGFVLTLLIWPVVIDRKFKEW